MVGRVRNLWLTICISLESAILHTFLLPIFIRYESSKDSFLLYLLFQLLSGILETLCILTNCIASSNVGFKVHKRLPPSMPRIGLLNSFNETLYDAVVGRLDNWPVTHSFQPYEL